jgi:hypothetical protein
MAQHQPGSLDADDFVSKAKATAGSVASSGANVATPANYASNTSLDARLTAISGTIYSQANLDKMTANDKAYAIRLNDDAGTI